MSAEAQPIPPHYAALAIQPADFCHANNIGFLAGSAIKYISRHRRKGGAEDLHKALHFVQMLQAQDVGPLLKSRLGAQRLIGGMFAPARILPSEYIAANSIPPLEGVIILLLYSYEQRLDPAILIRAALDIRHLIRTEYPAAI